MLALFVAPTLTLGPAALTYPELAQALTNAGMPTEVAPSLADRAAFVRLKGRTPEAARAVLGEALGVAFQPAGAGWRMVADPIMAERDRLFLAQYRRQAVEAARAWVTAQDALLNRRDYAAADRDVQAASKGYAKLDGPPDAATKARLRRLFALSVLLNPSAWAGLPGFRDGAAVAAAISGPQGRTVAVEGLRLPPAALGEPAPKALDTTLVFDPATGLMACDARREDGKGLPDYPFQASIGPYAVAGTGGRAEARVEGVTLVETFNRMGQAAGDYLRSFDPPPVLPAAPVAKGPVPATLSSVLERLDLEAAMELSPRFEVLTVRAMPAAISLRDAFTIAPYPAVADPTGAPPWLVEISRLEDRTSVVARARAFPWRVRVRDGVFEIVDPVAFLDRAQPLSPVPDLRVERLLAALPADAPTDLAGTPLPDWARLEAIAAAASGGLTEGYRGLSLGGWGPLLPIVRLVATLPAEARAAMWRDAARTEGVQVPVGGGTLTLEASLWGAEYGFKLPVAHLVGRWTGPKGATVYGEGTLDPRGTLTP